MPKTMQISKTCNDGAFNSISELKVDSKYDTIKIVNGQASDRVTLFKSSDNINFPFNLDAIVSDRTKVISIGLQTDKMGHSYSLEIQPKDWARDTLFFVFYYRQ